MQVAGRLADNDRGVVLAHYDRVASLIAGAFPHAPVIAEEFPDGLGGRVAYTASWHTPLPESIPYADVGEPDARKRYAAIAVNSLLWLVHRGAVGFGSWTPSPRDPERVGFARILITQRNGATVDQLRDGMLAIRATLFHAGVEAIPVLDGGNGAALFIPFEDARRTRPSARGCTASRTPPSPATPPCSRRRFTSRSR